MIASDMSPPSVGEESSVYHQFCGMSFMGGSACSTGSNPLAQMAKQQSVDRTHQFEQMQGPSGQASLRGDSRQMSASDRHMLQSMDRASPASFQYGDMRQELGKLGPQGPMHAGPAAGQSDWASDFHGKFATPANSQWASEFRPAQHSAPMHAGPSEAGPSTMPRSTYMPSMSMSMGMPMGGMMRPMTASGNMQAQSRVVELSDDKWEEQFRNIETQSSTTTPQPEQSAQAS